MNLSYSSTFSLTTAEVLIKKGSPSGGGLIPEEISVRSITLIPGYGGSAFPAYHVKGIHSDSEWVKVDPLTPTYLLDITDDNNNLYLYVKSDSGTITMNVHVRGRIG